MKYFADCRTLDELKTAYRKLAKKFHPDLGGSTEEMKIINNDYEKRFNELNGGATAGSSRTKETATDFIKIIDILLRLEGLKLELCGSWLWISGETRTHKDTLKAAGCKWASKKKMWYWTVDGTARSRYGGNVSMDRIRSRYGSRVIRREENALA